jgi:hypothetical protein
VSIRRPGSRLLRAVVVEGSGFRTTVKPTVGCRELAIFSSYVYDVPVPEKGMLTITPGDQPSVRLHAARLSRSGAATVYYARKGSGRYTVTVTRYRQTGDVRDAG